MIFGTPEACGSYRSCAIFRAGVVAPVMDRAGAGSNAMDDPNAVAARNPCRPVQISPFVAVVPSHGNGVRTVVRIRYYSQAIATVRYHPSYRDPLGFKNFCRRLAGSSFRSLHHLRQEPRSGFAKCFELLCWVFAHVEQPTHGEFGNAQKSSGEIRNVVR